MDVLAPPRPRTLTRRRFLTLSGLSALSAIGFAGYAGEVSRHEISIESHSLQIGNLPDSFHGLRIVQVSDFHYQEFAEAFFVRRVVEQVNRLQPDLVLMTGDYVSYGPLPVSFARRFVFECGALLKNIECPLKFAVLGNHDCVVGDDYVTDALESNQIHVLENKSVPLERDGRRLWIAGTGSACCQHSRPEIAIPKAVQRGEEPGILLAHEPDLLPEMARYNVDLMLSGHTHGGQVRVPLLPAMYLPPYGRKYIQGLFRHGPTQLYVNRGIGAVEVPFRLNCPPEITLFTLE